jgi:hypothetical protein
MTRRRVPPTRKSPTDNGGKPIQAPQEVPGPNTHPEPDYTDYPYVPGYACIPEQLYDMVIESIFSQPYGKVAVLGRQLENVSTITKAKKQDYEARQIEQNEEQEVVSN